jgi:class 3 adenylate cyclase
LAQERVVRRLAAILTADVADYGRLIEEDEEGTRAALEAIRRELSDPKLKDHRGRIVNTTGDGLLIEFASIVDAVRCAVDVQQGMAERNAQIEALAEPGTVFVSNTVHERVRAEHVPEQRGPFCRPLRGSSPVIRAMSSFCAVRRRRRPITPSSAASSIFRKHVGGQHRL